MNIPNLDISIYRAGYVCTDNIFKDKKFTDERVVENYELVIFLSDGGHFQANDKKYTITAGSARLYRAGDKVISYKFNDVYSVHFMISENNNKDVLEAIPTFFTLPNLKETVNMIEDLSSSLLENDNFGSVCKLCSLLSYIKPLTTPHARNKNIIASVKNYIDTNFNENITLESLSTIFYLHPVYLQRKFKQEYSLSPTDYTIKVRINHAKNYLISTNMSVEEISYKVGFSYPSYFIKTFKKHENCTPHQYRKLIQSSN